MATGGATVVVVVKEVTGHDGNREWTIKPYDDDENNRRFDAVGLKNRIQDEWVRRGGQEPLPGTDHAPILFDEGDTIRFMNNTDYPIGIGVRKNAAVSETQDAPYDPLVGEPSVQPLVPGGTYEASVKGGSRRQGFYKFHGWVFVDGTFIPIDPDGYCGG